MTAKADYKNLITFVWVKDWSKAIKFYCETLGCTKAYESEGWAELSIPGVRNAYLAINQWKKDAPLPRNEFVTLGVNDLDAFRAHLAASGVHLKGEIAEYLEEGQGMRMFKFGDPDGNILTASAVEQ
jgi:catechol 2,3-dioxygenase-like lactoylglutathione lyase family enzyme